MECCSHDTEDLQNYYDFSGEPELHCEHSSECCNIIHKYLKLDNEYLLSTLNISLETMVSVVTVLNDFEDFPESDQFKDIPQYLLRLPPLISGKSLLFFLNKLKIDPSVVFIG
jgi:hypothetical protein